jgi:hypothetical protein
MVEMTDIKKELERQIKDFRKDVDLQFKDVDSQFKEVHSLFRAVDHRFNLVDKEFELVRKDIQRLEGKVGAGFAGLKELLEPMRSIPERVARLEGATQAQSP